MDGPLLELTNITKSFGALRAVRGVSFTLRPGEVHALLGENGAGKTTLIKIVTGAHQPDCGIVTVAGEAVERLTPRAAHQLGVACIYQQPALFADLSVAENIALAFEPPSPWRRVDWAQRRAHAQSLLCRAGATIDPDREVRQLSMPEQQLVEIAKALGVGARIVIMDEPTASLTHAEVDLLLGAVRQLRASGVGVIYISHRLEEIFAVADRVTVLRDGASVGTAAIAGTDEAALIKLMVGREMEGAHPPAEAPPGEVLLSLRHLGCAASAVRDVNLDVRRGEVVGLAGLVGAGRTELARVLFGITPADTGTIMLGDEPVRIRSPREAITRGVAYVPEDRRRHGVILEMAVGANMTMAIHPQIFPGGWLRPRREQETAQALISDLAVKTAGPHAAASSLSGGNQQKVALSRWLATHPKVLILDEPTQGVDVGAKAEIHRIVRRLAREGVAILMISSDLTEILGMSDRIAVMRRGTIAAILEGTATAPEVMAAALG